jgi:gamma-glutamyl phosphate reductase
MNDMTQTPEMLISNLGKRARKAAAVLAGASDMQKAQALRAAAQALRNAERTIIAANARDMENGAMNGLSPAMLDRLKLDSGRVAGIASAVEAVADLTDPVGAVIDESQRPNGMVLQRVRVPLGVIGIIYESRPNVTADAAALCLRSGNAVILRGGSEAMDSNRAIHAAMVEGIKAAGLPADAVHAESGRSDRHHHPARRQKPRRAGAGRGASASARSSGRHLPYLCAWCCGPRYGAGRCAQCQNAADGNLRGDGDAADRQRFC